MKRQVDEIDRSIAQLLMKDGRMSTTDIARELGNVTDRTVSNRIKHLIERGVMKIVPIIDPKALGFSITADLSIETDPKQILQVARKLAAMEQVSYVSVVAGDRDISAQVHVPSAIDLQNFITGDLVNIEGVSRSRTQLLTQVLKDIDQWTIPEALPGLDGDGS
jgi:DNA-binding Lrp family transcriptional regulator